MLTEEDSPEARRLPPRKVIHPSEKGVWTRRFYHSLVLLFISLLAGLIFWGHQLTSR
jgi:hypothetical protein